MKRLLASDLLFNNYDVQQMISAV